MTVSAPFSEPLRLRTLLADYPGTRTLKSGELSSDRVALDFANVKLAQTAFKRVVRDLEFDVAELAIVTFLMAKARRAFRRRDAHPGRVMRRASITVAGGSIR